MSTSNGKSLNKRFNKKGGKSWNFKKPLPSVQVDREFYENEDSLIHRPESTGENPYRGWLLYFPDEEYSPGSQLANKITAAEGYLERNASSFIAKEIEEKRALILDYQLLINCQLFLDAWPKFVSDLSENPAESLNCLSLALHQWITKDDTDDACVSLLSLRVRLLNYEPLVPIKNLKAGLYGKLVTVQGTVILVGSCALMSTTLAFSCNACKIIQAVHQPDGLYTVPSKCPAQSCRTKTFTPLCSSKLTRTVSLQTIKIQENICDEQREGGRVPRNIEVELTEDLVGTCGPGDNVTITAIVKVRNGEEGKGRNKNNMFTLYLCAVSLHNLRGSSQSNMELEFSLKDYYAIQEIHNEPSPFRLLVNSLCPSVYGHEMIKAGLLLALIGGAQSGVPATSGVSTRGDIHVLIVGDPGLGKSHMLHAAAALPARGVYVCGNTTSSSGLTVTLAKEAGGDYALEAGALVLASNGACCIDEFDKMSSQHQALLQAMEEGCVSIAKGGVVATLPARTSIIAAANPVGGHYNRSKTVSENIKLGQALLSRFDLVFILLDKPNERLDSLLSEHVMALHAGRVKKKSSTLCSVLSLASESVDDSDPPLIERLKMREGENLNLVPQPLLRKYIGYTRKYVPSPRLSRGAASVLQQFYLELRKAHHNQQSTPVTTRQLESLIRLTHARAKVELREEATEQDAKEVVELMRWSLMDTFTDGKGILDFSRSSHGSGMSSGSKAKRFIAALQRRAQLEAKSIFTVSEMKELAGTLSIQVPDFYSFLESLNTQGFILNKGSNNYQLLSV